MGSTVQWTYARKRNLQHLRIEQPWTSFQPKHGWISIKFCKLKIRWRLYLSVLNFWAIIVKQSSVIFVSSKHARIMFHQTEIINSNAHAILNEAFLKYFYYDSSGHESTKSICFFSFVETKNAALIHACIINKGKRFRPTDMKFITLAFRVPQVIMSLCWG